MKLPQVFFTISMIFDNAEQDVARDATSLGEKLTLKDAFSIRLINACVEKKIEFTSDSAIEVDFGDMLACMYDHPHK